VAGEVRYYSVDEAARVLRLTPERILEMLEAGELDGIPTGQATWRIPIHGDIDVPPPPVTEVPAETPTGHSEARDLPDEPGEPRLHPAVTEEARQPVELFHGDHVATNREPTSESGWVSTQQAARALGISARTVRWHIERGNLEAIPEGEGVERTWRVSVDSLQAYRDSRQVAAPSPRGSRVSDIGSDIAAESPGSAIRELADRLVEEARRAEAARVRLELSERAQSTLEAELESERLRREAAERERDDLRRELHEWHRLEETAEATAHEIHDRLADERSHEATLSEPSESPEPRPGTPTPPETSTEAQEASERPWWRFWA
jgi:excisionase family DNA binding protein